MPDFALKSAQFRREREAAWRELEELLARVEKEGLQSLTAAELHRLPVLYRSADQLALGGDRRSASTRTCSTT